MKNLCISFLLLISAWAPGPANAQNPLDPDNPGVPPADILIELQVVELPEQVAFPLIQDLKDPSKAEAAYQQIQNLLMKGTAKLIGWPTLITRPGERGVVEAIKEFRFATEYKEGGVGVYLTNPGGEIVKDLKEIKGVELNALPVAFETRNVGVTLEAEGVLGLGGEFIDLRLVPQHVRLKAMNKVSIQREKTGEKMIVEQPEFETHKVTTSLRVKSGARRLLSVFKTSEPQGNLELFILTAEVNKLE